MLTTTQRLKILPIRIVISLIWFVDSLRNIPELIFVNGVRAGFVLFVASFFYPGTATNTYFHNTYGSLKLVPDGVVHHFYGNPPYSFNTGGVLGTAVRSGNPHQVKEVAYPILSARAALVVDVKSGKTLFNLNGEQRFAPASTTKLMTALVAVENYSLDEVLTVPEHCTTVSGQKAGLLSGEEVSVTDLIKSLLISSAGDSACVLATTKMSYDEFVDLMNEKAGSVGMTQTHFTNPIGFDGVDSTHYSTAYDLYNLALSSMDVDVIRDSVGIKEYPLNVRTLYNTNRLLWEIPQTAGIKTGTTAEAGEVLIYSFKDEEKELIIVVMGSRDRFTDTKELLYWTLNSFSWK
jgi:D-alanyl-D-alanine carboxypeptidase